ncbi:5'-methylthioadenosine/adenosylhomocysteine nucleosidase [Paraferrimonas sp. SM1919]|uniref:5'-methylthioadenosine/adenosylhomocysteine nucleosidase n=1 Tax=Paraferrimonas sp. SM1919 TaxID=2662263 RepID=UPI0013D83119|nr:5'-methylthioadenosine/adenosylhomocysteine nucleosidase [Paraferrimonas sp. SM1919]
MKIGIIGAMEPEVVSLVAALTNKQQQTIAGVEFYSGQIDGVEVVITRSGIGKVAATVATTLLISQYQPSHIINTGSAGGFVDTLDIGDVVISDEVLHHDVDATAFGYVMGQVPQQPATFKADQTLINAAQVALEPMDNKGITGLIGTGDSFIADPNRTKVMLEHFPNLAACEMEGAAIAQTAHQFNVPFVVIRSLSDNANNDSPVDFESYIKLAGKRSAELVMAMLKLI